MKIDRIGSCLEGARRAFVLVWVRSPPTTRLREKRPIESIALNARHRGIPVRAARERSNAPSGGFVCTAQWRGATMTPI